MKRSLSTSLLLGLLISCTSRKTRVIYVKPVLCYKYPCVTTMAAGVVEHPEGVDNPLNWYLSQKGKNKIPGKKSNQLKQLDFTIFSLIPENNTGKPVLLQKNQKLFINYSPAPNNLTSSKLTKILSVKKQGNKTKNSFLRATVKSFRECSKPDCNSNLASSQQYLLSFYYKFGSVSKIPDQQSWSQLKKYGYEKYETPLLDARKPYFLLDEFPQTNHKLWLAFFRYLFPLALNQGKANSLTYLRYKGIKAFFAGNIIPLDTSHFLYFILPAQKIIYKIPTVHPAQLLFFLRNKGFISFPQMYRSW
ncbi:MAG: hypothetical protein PF689_07580, partial [Deltaproteobacteria bacterium]|nr:hypothetical protein [Deltaproteobacteria bacterium]